MPTSPPAPLPSRRFAGFSALLAALLALAGCAPRAVPASFPASSAASPASAEAPSPRLGVALAEDPPLPGEPTDGWHGLEAGPPAPGAARSAPGRLLTADEAVRVALRSNRELRATLREVGVARGDLVQAGLLPNPEVEVEVTPRQASLDHTRIEVWVEFDLTSAILAPLRERAAQADLEAARYRAAGASLDIGYSVRAAYYAVQASQQRLAVASRALDTFAAGRDAARALFEAGNTPELDVATQEAAYESARITASQIELELLERREQLNRLLGFTGLETTWRARGDLPAADKDLAMPPGAEARAIKASLELAEMRARLEGAAGRAGLARTQGALPDVSIGARGEREDAGFTLGAGLRVALPIFDRKQGAAMAQEAAFDGLLERYHGLAIDVRSALREARGRLVSAHARARHYQAVVIPARERVAAQTLLQYNAMQLGIFQLLEARRGQLDAELAAIEARREYWTAKAAFDALLAGRLVRAAGAPAPAALSVSSRADEGGH